jgi:hypothetical protein
MSDETGMALNRQGLYFFLIRKGNNHELCIGFFAHSS